MLCPIAYQVADASKEQIESLKSETKVRRRLVDTERERRQFVWTVTFLNLHCYGVILNPFRLYVHVLFTRRRSQIHARLRKLTAVLFAITKVKPQKKKLRQGREGPERVEKIIWAFPCTSENGDGMANSVGRRHTFIPFWVKCTSAGPWLPEKKDRYQN
jgi:hypothetical protein